MRRDCAACGNRGLIRVQYQSGEPYDIAICDCVHGRVFRDGGAELVRAWLVLGPEHQIAYREDFDGEAPMKPAGDFLQAGHVGKRAKL